MLCGIAMTRGKLDVATRHRLPGAVGLNLKVRTGCPMTAQFSFARWRSHRRLDDRHPRLSHANGDGDGGIAHHTKREIRRERQGPVTVLIPAHSPDGDHRRRDRDGYTDRH